MLIGQESKRLQLSRYNPGPQVWTLLTFVTMAVKNKGQLYVVRALVGFSEAPCYAGIHFILGSWYRKEELVS